MLRRVIALITTVFLVVPMLCAEVSAQVYEDIPQDSLSSALKNIISLGIMTGYDDGTFRPDNNITRAETATIISRVLKMGDYIGEGSRFIDVSGEHWALGTISAIAESGIMNGDGNGVFRPDDNVTYTELLTILVKITGYDFLAQEAGGFPHGYVVAAAKLGVTKNFSGDLSAPASREGAANLIYNAMQVKLTEKVYSHDSLKVGEETLYSRFLKYESLHKGTAIVTANKTTGLYSKEGTRAAGDQVEIGGKKYYIGLTDVDKYLGQTVQYFVSTDEVSGTETLVSVTAYKNTIMEIKPEDIENVSIKEVVYSEDNGKLQTIALSSELKIIYNSVFTDQPLESLVPKTGVIKFIDNNEDDVFDVAFVESYTSLEVERISTVTKAIYFKEGSTPAVIRLSSDIYDIECTISDTDGNLIELEDIKEKSIVTVRADIDYKYIELVVSNNSVSGIVNQIYFDDKEIIIDDKEYKLLDSFVDNYADEVKVGEEMTFLIDCYGNIVSIDSSASNLTAYALVHDIKADRNLRGGTVLRFIYGGHLVDTTKEDGEGKVISYEMGNSDVELASISNSIRLNGQRVTPDNIAARLAKGSAVKLTKNSNGSIIAIDVLESYNQLGLNQKLAFNPRIKSFGGKFYIDENTSIMLSPENEITDDDDFFVKLKLDVSTKYAVNAYDVDEKTKVAKAISIVEDMHSEISGNITDSTPIALVTKLVTAIEEDGEHITYLTGYSDGKEINYPIKDNVKIKDIRDKGRILSISDISAGTLIYYSVNTKSRIDSILFINDINPLPNNFEIITKEDAEEQVLGTLYTLKTHELSESLNDQVNKITISQNASAITGLRNYEIRETKMPPVYYYDTRTNVVSVIDIDDLMDYESFDEDASVVYLCKTNNIYKAIIAVK